MVFFFFQLIVETFFLLAYLASAKDQVWWFFQQSIAHFVFPIWQLFKRVGSSNLYLPYFILLV